MLKEKYKELKLNHPKSIIFIKSGSFFITFNQDAIIINKILNYKIKKLNNDYIRVGFPISSINKVSEMLTRNEINYIIYEDDIIDNIKFNHNKYNNYIAEFYSYQLAKDKINYITEKLNDNLFNPSIINILNEIEKVICKINY